MAAFPVTGETGKIYIALDTNFSYRWSGSVYVDITSKVDSVNTKTGVVVIDPDDLDDTSTTNKFNQTHTGEVTGSGALTVDPTAITNKTSATPESGDFFLFSDTSDSGALKKADFSDLGGAGGGTGEGGLNYVTNSGAEVDLTGWSNYNDGAVAVPVDGTGASSNHVFTRTTTAANLLIGSASFFLAKPASNEQGQGVSTDITIDQRYTGSKINVIFEYKNGSTTLMQSGDYKVYVYDVTNAVMSEVSNDDGGDILVHTGDGATFQGAFYASDSLSYRLIIHNTSTNTNSMNLYFDRVRVTPDEPTPTAILTDTVYEVGSGGWTNTDYDVWWSRVGDVMRVKFRAECNAAPAGTTFTLTIPDGQSIDAGGSADKMFNNDRGVVGTASIFDASGSTYTAIVRYQSQTSVRVLANLSQGSGNESIHGTLTPTSPFSFVSGDRVFGEFEVPIEDWVSGNVISSTERLHSNVDVRGDDNGATVLTANTTNIDFTEVSDDYGAWNGSLFTAYKTGKHKFMGVCYFSAVYSGLISGYKNGTIDKLAGIGTGSTSCAFDVEIYLQAGDTFSLRSDTAATLASSSTLHWLSASMVQELTSFGVYGEFNYASGESSAYTPTTSSRWYPISGNDIDLETGTWLLLPSQCAFYGSGGGAAFGRFITVWSSDTPVSETSTAPTDLSGSSSITVLTSGVSALTKDGFFEVYPVNSAEGSVYTGAVIIQAHQPVTIYQNAFGIINAGAGTTARIHLAPNALRLR